MKIILTVLLTCCSIQLAGESSQQGGKMDIWFDGSNNIDCDIQQVKQSLENLGEHYVAIVGLMPGLSSVELVDQGPDYVTIKTNEGYMKRTQIALRINGESVVVEFDEEYKAGSMITTRSHFSESFTPTTSGIEYRLVISNLTAPGFMGFFYRNFGSSNTGNAFLNSYKTYYEGNKP
ncbi:MAG: hypothetical protein ISS12_09030 [Candidatus Marinimicrobia bacterium]|nr:hypothetical protein [Candidatus Neomarinimicrobiota bacterium]